MAFVSAATYVLSLPTSAAGRRSAAAAASVELVHRPLTAPLRAARGFAPVEAAKKKTISVVGNLLRALEGEINSAQEYIRNEEQDAIPENFPFEIHDEEGMSVITLERDYKGEKIEVVVSMPNAEIQEGTEYDDEDNEEAAEDTDKGDNEEGDNPEDSSVSLIVTISKGSGPSLEFTCTAYSDEITIDDLMMVESTKDGGEQKFAYEGPNFNEYPDRMQEGFSKYLEQRGITLETTNFVHDYMVSKQTREYERWMRKLKDFIKQ